MIVIILERNFFLTRWEDISKKKCYVTSFISWFLEWRYRPVGGRFCINDGNDFKEYLYVSHIIISTIASSHISSGLLEESSFVEDLLKKHYSEDSTMQSLARAIFGFSLANNYKKLLNFFSKEKII